tara:strand:+ start:170 stop:379 length:210 start_codon:yes stop_codon:yes gene_type:complete
MNILDMIFNDPNIDSKFKKAIKKIPKDVEYVSVCCDSLPVEDSVLEQNSLLGYCRECGMGSEFKKNEEK